MKNILIILMLGFVRLNVFATTEDGDEAVLRSCLKQWPNNPFKAKKELSYRTISTKVKVMGIGSNVNDTEQTEKPELVLVKPGVAVMAKTTYDLMNHNGWYCLKGKVSVLGKIEINLHCKAKIASSGDSTEVLGATDAKSGGVAVLGSVRVNRNCQ